MNTPKNTPAKPGVKTSEFWLVVAFTALANLGPLAQSIEGPWGIVANAIVVAGYALSRGNAKKVGVILPALLIGFALVGLTSCGIKVESYTVDGSDLDWKSDPIQLLEPERVTPNVNLPLPSQLGGGTITVPATITPSK